MSLGNCKIEWNAAATLHERVWEGIGRAGIGRGGPIASGSFAGMMRRVLSAPKEKVDDLSITVDAYVAGGKTWLEIADIRELSGRPDFPKD